MRKLVVCRGPRKGRSFASGDRGQVLILTALSMTVLLGIAALSIDASFMYDKRNRLFAAADAAAKSAAIEVYRGNTTLANLQAFADMQVTTHGFNPGGTTTVTVNHPPTSGPFTGIAAYVEVIVSEPTSTFFATVLGFTGMTPGARAVAGTSPNANCIVTLAPTTWATTSLDMGNSSINMPGCGVADDGNLNIGSSGSITAATTGVTGICDGPGGGGGCAHVTNLITSALPLSDPLATLPIPSNPGSCVAAVNQASLTAGCYSTITTTLGTLSFGPGLYYITGPILISNNVTVTATGGVLFFLAGSASFGPCVSGATAGCFNVGNNANWTLAAQTSGPYNGILFFQDPANHLNAEFTGNGPTYNLSGAMYFPGAQVSFRNGMNATNNCTLFVAWTVEVGNGTAAFNNTCTAFGGSPILTVSIGE